MPSGVRLLLLPLLFLNIVIRLRGWCRLIHRVAFICTSCKIFFVLSLPLPVSEGAPIFNDFSWKSISFGTHVHVHINNLHGASKRYHYQDYYLIFLNVHFVHLSIRCCRLHAANLAWISFLVCAFHVVPFVVFFFCLRWAAVLLFAAHRHTMCA